MALVGLDAEAEFLRRLLPGRHYLAWYDADEVYHERVALWPQTRARWVILTTPDLDVYSEMLDGSEGVASSVFAQADGCRGSTNPPTGSGKRLAWTL